MATNFFARFSALWGSNGGLEVPTDDNANAGFEYLGDIHPSKQLFNWMFQTVDARFGWLYGQLKTCTDAAGIALSSGDLTALQRLFAKKQDALGFVPVQQGGGTNQGANKIFLGWDGSNIRVTVDKNDIGGLSTTANVTTSVATETNRALSNENAILAALNSEAARAKGVEAVLAAINNPAFQGRPTVPSPPAQDNSGQIPNTNWVLGAILTGFILAQSTGNAGTGAFFELPGGWIINLGVGVSGPGGIATITYGKAVNATFATFACEVAATGSWFGGSGQGAPTDYGCYGQTNTGMGVLCMSWVASANAWQGHQGGGFSWISFGKL